MKRVYYDVRGTKKTDIAARLKASLCPGDAVVKFDPATGIVAITTTGPWRPQTLPSGKVVESGIGVSGWGLEGVEEIDPGKENDPPEMDDLTLAKIAHVDAAPIDVSK